MTDLKKNWLGFLVLIYSLTLCFMIVVVLMTSYALSHPELGLIEGNPAIRSLFSKYGLALGLLLGFLQNTLFLFFFWPLFVCYIKLMKEYYWYKVYGDSIAYSWMSAYGLSACIFSFLDMINDIYSAHAQVSSYLSTIPFLK